MSHSMTSRNRFFEYEFASNFDTKYANIHTLVCNILYAIASLWGKTILNTGGMGGAGGVPKSGMSKVLGKR